MPPYTFTSNALQVLEERYLLRDARGVVKETPVGMFRRVARHIATAEEANRKEWEYRFFELMTSLKFLPNSPTLMNAGTPQGQLSACFVLPVEDSLEGIFTSLKHAALIHQSGGGTGYNFSRLRQKGELISSSKGFSSGPLAFMKIFDTATEHVKQGGKRRGANMGILNVDHPDIVSFISAKRDKTSLQNFNISVGITDLFMQAVEQDLDWELKAPGSQGVVCSLPAKTIWNEITGAARETGDPGLIFLDAVNRSNPTPGQGSIQSTNPCGEVPLLDYESCNLGSINLSKMVLYHTHHCDINYGLLSETVHLAIRFLDNVINVNHYLLPQIESLALKNRKIGLGVMGWAELLMLLEIPYASEKAVELAAKLMAFIQKESYKASEYLAKERGCFPSWASSILCPFQKNAQCHLQ
jgi:ribonucleoside-diphosphate reductase alpha chain